MELQTQVRLERPDFQITYADRILMLGSCFAENIGERFTYFRFNVDVNPCGIIYNPLSVAQTLDFLINKRIFSSDDLLKNGEQWVSFYHHGYFSSLDSHDCLQKINARFSKAYTVLPETNILLITFGTAWVYRHKATGLIVSNCHKFPTSDFEQIRVSSEQIVEIYKPLLRHLKEIAPQLKIVFTVSPIRHWKDGAHGNQLSKAILLLAIEELVQLPDVYYFPSYEIVMDELRDYRFYAEDMCHVSSQAIAYIWEKFRDTYISPESVGCMKLVDKLNKKMIHRPLNPESEEYRRFKSGVILEMEALKKTNQYINFQLQNPELFFL